MGAVTISDVRELSWPFEPGQVAKVAKVEPSASYATGGETIDLADLGLRRLNGAWVCAATTGNAGTRKGSMNGHFVDYPNKAYMVYVDTYTDPTAPTLVLYKGDLTVAEETAAVDVSTCDFWIIFVGEQ